MSRETEKCSMKLYKFSYFGDTFKEIGIPKSYWLNNKPSSEEIYGNVYVDKIIGTNNEMLIFSLANNKSKALGYDFKKEVWQEFEIKDIKDLVNFVRPADLFKNLKCFSYPAVDGDIIFTKEVLGKREAFNIFYSPESTSQ